MANFSGTVQKRLNDALVSLVELRNQMEDKAKSSQNRQERFITWIEADIQHLKNTAEKMNMEYFDNG